MIFIFKVHVHKLAYCMHVETLSNSGKLVFVLFFCFFLHRIVSETCNTYALYYLPCKECTSQSTSMYYSERMNGQERLVAVVTSPSCLSALIWSRKQTSRHTNDVTWSLVLTLSRTAEFLMFLLNAFTQPNISPVKQCA